MGTYNVDLAWFGIEAETPEEAVEHFRQAIQDSHVVVSVTDDETGDEVGEFRLNGGA